MMDLSQQNKFSEEAKISEDVCLEVYFQAKLLNNEELSNKAKDVITKELKNISQREYFKTLDKDSVVELINEIQNFTCEDDIAESILAWIDFDKNRQTHFKEFLYLLQIENIKPENIFVINELFKRCSEKEEYAIIINAVKKGNSYVRIFKSNEMSSQSQRLCAFVETNDRNYILLEYDYGKAEFLNATKIQNHGIVLGVWDNTILFHMRKELFIYDVQLESISSSIYIPSKFYCSKVNPKIGDHVYILAVSSFFKLNLLDNSLNRFHPFDKQDLDWVYDAMIEFNDELIIMAYKRSDPYSIEMITYNPLKNEWNSEATVLNIMFCWKDWSGMLVSHRNHLYYFRNDSLHIYDFENKHWRSTKTDPEIHSQTIYNCFSIGDKLIVCTNYGVYEYVEDKDKMEKIDIFGIQFGNMNRFFYS